MKTSLEKIVSTLSKEYETLLHYLLNSDDVTKVEHKYVADAMDAMVTALNKADRARSVIGDRTHSVLPRD